MSRPRAQARRVRNGAPFKALALPPAMAKIQARLAGAAGGDRQMVSVLVVGHENSVEAVEQACAEALEAGLRSADAILNILSRQNRETIAEPVVTPAHLRLSEEPIADCARLMIASSRRRAVERHELIGLMRELKLAGMRAAYDDIMRAGVQHRRGPTGILGDLLKAELTEKTGAGR